MVRILPDTFRHDQRRIRVQLAKNFDPHFLRINEAMLFDAVERVGANHLPAFRFQRGAERLFHFVLFRPAVLVGGRAKVATGDEANVF